MRDNFIRMPFNIEINVEKLITLLYIELTKHYGYGGEKHDFWELVYIDKGEIICTAEKNKFTLKSGELIFHKPNEYHNLGGNNKDLANVSIVTFVCNSKAMEYFGGKIFKLSAKEKEFLSCIFTEGLSCYKKIESPTPPIRMKEKENAPFGASQMIKNYLEIFLIMLSRNRNVLTKAERRNITVDGISIPYNVKEIIDCINANIYNSITVSDISVTLGQSESKIKKLFAEYYSGGIKHYYNNAKIKEARRLIRDGSYNISQISEMLCFDNPQYFSKCFKLYSGMTPSEYKSSILNL